MPDRLPRRKAVFAAVARRQYVGCECEEAAVTDGSSDGRDGGAGKASESRAPKVAEPSAAERRAQALRENLRRRKTQARARKPGAGGESPTGG